MTTDVIDIFIDDCLERHGPLGAIRLLSVLFEKEHDLRYLIGCARALPSLAEDPACFSDLMWNINVKLLSHSDSLDAERVKALRYQIVVPAYFRLLDLLSNSMGGEPIGKTFDPSSATRVVFVSHQILSLKHSPTHVCFEYAAELSRQGIEVLVLNANLLPREPVCGFYSPVTAATSELPATDSWVKYEEVTLKIYSENNKSLTEDKIKACLERARAFSPSVVLSHGELNVVGDLLAREYPTICLPTTRSEPVSQAHVFVDFGDNYVRPLAISSTGLLAYEPEIRCLPANIGVKAARTKVKRSSLGFKPDDRVFVVVGNRLQLELGERFEKIIVHLFSAARSARLLLIGLAEKQWNDPALAAYADRIVFREFETDLRALFSICDVFLNPPRQGGGNSSVIAVAAKLPILTLKNCDVASVVGTANSVIDDQAIEQAAISWATDDAELECARRRAARILDELNGVDEHVQKLRSFFDDAARVFQLSGKF